jgi:plasmid stabilization system protein ParE
MTYRVVITPEAERDLRDAYRYIRRDSPPSARRWIRGARKAIKTLAHLPDRYPLAPEAESFGEPIRELFYGSGNRGTYRILYLVIESTACVVHVRHGSMDQLR